MLAGCTTTPVMGGHHPNTQLNHEPDHWRTSSHAFEQLAIGALFQQGHHHHLDNALRQPPLRLPDRPGHQCRQLLPARDFQQSRPCEYGEFHRAGNKLGCIMDLRSNHQRCPWCVHEHCPVLAVESGEDGQTLEESQSSPLFHTVWGNGLFGR